MLHRTRSKAVRLKSLHFSFRLLNICLINPDVLRADQLHAAESGAFVGRVTMPCARVMRSLVCERVCSRHSFAKNAIRSEGVAGFVCKSIPIPHPSRYIAAKIMQAQRNGLSCACCTRSETVIFQNIQIVQAAAEAIGRSEQSPLPIDRFA